MNLLKLCCVNINFANLVEWGKKNRLTTSFGVIFVYFSLSHSTVVWRYLVWTVYHCTITTTSFKGKKEKYWHSKKKYQTLVASLGKIKHSTELDQHCFGRCHTYIAMSILYFFCLDTSVNNFQPSTVWWSRQDLNKKIRTYSYIQYNTLVLKKIMFLCVCVCVSKQFDMSILISYKIAYFMLQDKEWMKKILKIP